MLVLVLACALSVTVAGAQAKLGINLAGIADWNTELPFVDLMKMSRDWVSQRDGAPFGQGPKLSIDAQGWVTKLEPGCRAETFFLTGCTEHAPAGDYVVLYNGNGVLTFSGVRVVSSHPGRIAIRPSGTAGGCSVRIQETDPSNYLRDIRILIPGVEKTYNGQPFNPSFLGRWRGVSCLRFMDWMVTNGSEQQVWSDRPKPSDRSYMDKGVPVEIMLQLANQLQADPWFCMPAKANDNYVSRFADAVKARLKPVRKVYLELSNECWNSGFSQTRWLWDQAKILGIGPKERPWEGGAMLYARRAVQDFNIWTSVFGGRRHLVRVLAWQCGSTWWLDHILMPFERTSKNIDAIALAPYIPFLASPGGKLNSDEVATWSLNQLMRAVQAESLNQAIDWIHEMKSEADKYHVKLLAYEGGQHLVGVGGGENNHALTTLFLAANADPRMGAIYDKYFQAWSNSGGGTLCYFSSVGVWSKWGSWGALQFADDDPSKSPKFAALRKFAKNCDQVLGSRDRP